MNNTICKIFLIVALMVCIGIFTACTSGNDNKGGSSGDDDISDDDLIDDDSGDDDSGINTTTSTTTTTTTSVTTTTQPGTFSDDFEGDTPGSPPGDPWEVNVDSGATITVVSLKDGSGNVVEFNDPSVEGIGSMLAKPDADLMNVPFGLEWDWLWVSGDGMSFQIYHKVLTNYKAVAAIDFSVDHIRASDSTGWVSCLSPVTLDQWYHFKIDVDPDAKKYSVSIDGNATTCADLGFVNYTVPSPVTAIGVYMYSTVNGGVTRFDNIFLAPTD